MATDGRETLAGYCRAQAEACAELGSPLWARVLRQLADDCAAGGVAWGVLRERADARFGEAVPLRLLGALHRLALTGSAPDLAATLPSCGGTSDPAAAWIAVHRLLRDEADVLRAALHTQVQTNEVARSAALVVGLLHVTASTGLPVALRELGTSGGLNLRLDRFRYEQAGVAHGPSDSPVRFTDRWEPALPPGAEVHVVDRAGCDPFPVDPTTDDGSVRLQSFVWPDQTERRERLLGAIEIARHHPARIERTTDTASWLERELDDRPSGAVTVVMHSIVWQYVDKPQRSQIWAVLRRAGEGATTDRPVAWLSMEPDPDDRSRAALDLRLWRGGGAESARRLAHAVYHGRWVRLLHPPPVVDGVGALRTG